MEMIHNHISGLLVFTTSMEMSVCAVKICFLRWHIKLEMYQGNLLYSNGNYSHMTRTGSGLLWIQ
jgi:hypothetical protein